jgi:hypothetical protein
VSRLSTTSPTLHGYESTTIVTLGQPVLRCFSQSWIYSHSAVLESSLDISRAHSGRRHNSAIWSKNNAVEYSMSRVIVDVTGQTAVPYSRNTRGNTHLRMDSPRELQQCPSTHDQYDKQLSLKGFRRCSRAC